MSSLEAYVGMTGLAMNPENLPELYESIDALHTMVMDNMGEDHPALNVLSEAMAKIEDMMSDEEFDEIH